MSQIPTPSHSVIQKLLDFMDNAKKIDQGKRFPNANPQSGEQIHPTFDFGSLLRNHMLYGRMFPQQVGLQDAIQRRVQGKNQVF